MSLLSLLLFIYSNDNEKKLTQNF